MTATEKAIIALIMMTIAALVLAMTLDRCWDEKTSAEQEVVTCTDALAEARAPKRELAACRESLEASLKLGGHLDCTDDGDYCVVAVPTPTPVPGPTPTPTPTPRATPQPSDFVLLVPVNPGCLVACTSPEPSVQGCVVCCYQDKDGDYKPWPPSGAAPVTEGRP